MYTGTLEAGMLVNYRLSGWKKSRQLRVTTVEKGVVMAVPTSEDVAALVEEFPAAAKLAASGLLSQQIHVEKSGIVSVIPRLPE